MRLNPFRTRPSIDVFLPFGVFSVLMIGALLLGGWTAYPKALSQVRNPLIGCGVLFAIFSVRKGYFQRCRETYDPVALRNLIFGFFLIAYLKAASLDYLSFNTVAIDGSVYDYAMMNTLRGQFMKSVTGINHFGIHATPVLFLLLPFHALFHTPAFSVLLQPITLFTGAVLFDRCLRRRGIEEWPRLGLLFAYFNSIWISRTLHYGFHVEVFYPAAFFLIDLSVSRTSRPVFLSGTFWLSILFFLSIKEDAPFYLPLLMLAYFVIRKINGRSFVLTAFLSLAVGFFYLHFLIPANAPSGAYHLAGAVGAAGTTPSEALRSFFGNPLPVIQRYFTGSWWLFFLPSLGILIGSPFFWIASLPILGLYSLAGGSIMYSLMLYYAIPLVGPLFLGLVESKSRSSLFLAISVASICLLGSGYLVFRSTDLSRWSAVRRTLLEIPEKSKICAPGSIVPQLPYGDVRLLEYGCAEDSDYVILTSRNSSLSIYPFDVADLDRIREQVKRDRDRVNSDSPEIEIFGKKR